MQEIFIKSEHLQLTEPLMAKYYDFHSTMFIDEIKHCVETSGINYKKIVNGDLAVDYDETFRENKDLYFITSIPYDKMIHEQFSDYFIVLDDDSEEEEIITEDDLVMLSLISMSYIYHKETKGLFQQSFIIDALDIEYESVLHNRIYPEMLSLYKIILESKKYKHRGDKITLTYKQDKIDINTCAWFLDDMESYFKDRFPDLTLEDINRLLPPKGKAGRKSANPYVMIIIWGTYQLLKNHHSYFKNEKTKISKELCEFILKYLNHIEAEHDFVDTDIKDNLKYMVKEGFTPKWNLPWRNVFSSIKEKEPEYKLELERLNQPKRYNLSNL